MSHVIWTADAIRGLERTYQFVARKNKPAAKRILKAIRGHVHSLLEHPHVGRPVPDCSPERRELLIDVGSNGYVVQYLVENGDVLVMALRHQKEMNW